tara:strand:- start:622 stop:774 length:153 start_codon:yes stop_codon:yes gene_type:complete
MDLEALVGLLEAGGQMGSERSVMLCFTFGSTFFSPDFRTYLGAQSKTGAR